MLNLIMLLVMAWMAGLVAYVLVSLLAGILPTSLSNRITGFNLDLVMTMLGRALLIKRENGGYTLKKSSWDPTVSMEKITIGGEPRWFKDPHGYMSRFRGKPLGIAHEARNVITTPVEADMGRRRAELESDDDWAVEKDGSEYKRSYFHLDEGLQLVDMDAVLHVIQGGASPASVDRAKTFIEISQRDFDSSAVADYMIWIAMLGAPFGMLLLASKVADTSAVSGGPGEAIGLMIQPVVVML